VDAVVRSDVDAMVRSDVDAVVMWKFLFNSILNFQSQ